MLQVEHKLFYFDLKENPRGRYLKTSEKTSATRSTIIVPFYGISWFFNYYVNSDDQDLFSKELQLDTKVFYFDIGENRRGRFLKGFEELDGFSTFRSFFPGTVLLRVLTTEELSVPYLYDVTCSTTFETVGRLLKELRDHTDPQHSGHAYRKQVRSSAPC